MALREIAFRGKRIDNGEWVVGMLARYNPLFTVANIVNEMEMLVPVSIATIGQYTGLKDKNGKRIFEGDIINGYTLTGVNDRRGVVVAWNELFSGWYAGENKSLFGGLGEIYEIIGNIQDNPELVEEVE